ncbi:MAG: hypothetical protein Q7R35_06410, partial [Elusimicrobiota bacterium]|nr:hypothetical protein [Elusimicrobiota bacterium]
MEPEILLLLVVSAAGLLAVLTVAFKSFDFVQLALGNSRERQSGKLIRQFNLALAVAENKIHVKSRNLEVLSRKLAASNITLEEMNNMKSKFLSMVVHDVRTP